MLLKDMINTIYAVLRKEERGGVFTADDFNRYVSMFSRRVYDEWKGEMERTGTVTESMERYIRMSINSAYGNDSLYNIVVQPEGFEKHLSAMGEYNGYKNRKIDLVTQLEFQERVGDYLTQPTIKNPLMKYQEGFVYVYPNVAFDLVYMVSPEIPFLDYYYDTNRNIQYMDEGDSVTITTGMEYRDGTTSGVKESQTVEMDLDEGGQIDVMNRMLRLLGVVIPNEGVFHYSTQEEVKNKP